MPIDLRFRSDTEVADVEPDEFFGRQLPSLFVERAELLVPADGLRLRVLVIDVDDRSWTLRRDDGTYSVARGAVTDPGRATARIRLDRIQLADLVTDQITPIGLMTAGALDQTEGQVGHVLDWWLVLRSVLDGRPVHRGTMSDLPDDLHRTFQPGDDTAEMRDFLERAGYLHIAGLFTAQEMAAVSADMDRAAPTYSEGDGRSWWATVDDGTPRLVRMQGFDEHSPTAAALLVDPRLTALSDLPGCGHRHTGMAGNRLEALFKPIGVVHGISDVPWHKDCSLGRHSYDCCNLTLGISVTGGRRGSGQLRVIAGSHRALVWPALLDPSTTGLPEVELPTETGDVTIHLSCTLHMAEPPVESERRVMYTSLTLPRIGGQAAAANRARLIASREKAPHNLADVPSRVP